MQSLQEAIEKNRSRKDITLSSGRTIRHHRMDNGAQDAIPTTGPRELTEVEWQDYCRKLGIGAIPEVTVQEWFDGKYVAHLWI